VFGVGGQELVIIGFLLLIVFGPARIGQMARDVGRFAYGARSSIQEFKDELTAVDPSNREMENGRRQRQGQKPTKKPLNKEEPQRSAEEG
jgi:sec-independent protein translocase protein TatB